MELNDRQMQLKGNLIETTTTPGWQNITQFAGSILQGMKDEAFLEEDQAKAEGKRRDARGAMKFWTELTLAIARTKALDAAPTADTFLDVVTD